MTTELDKMSNAELDGYFEFCDIRENSGFSKSTVFPSTEEKEELKKQVNTFKKMNRQRKILFLMCLENMAVQKHNQKYGTAFRSYHKAQKSIGRERK